MKVKVNEGACVGCGACEGTCQEVFKVEDFAKVIVEEVKEEQVQAVKDAIEGCPTGAIEEVK